MAFPNGVVDELHREGRFSLARRRQQAVEIPGLEYRLRKNLGDLRKRDRNPDDAVTL